MDHSIHTGWGLHYVINHSRVSEWTFIATSSSKRIAVP